jgi:hypothetical protein
MHAYMTMCENIKTHDTISNQEGSSISMIIEI